MESGLYDLAVKRLAYAVTFAPKLYNVLFYIQEAAFARSLPPLKKDMNRLSDTISSIKTVSGDRFPDRLVLQWVKDRTEVTLQDPRYIGMKTPMRAKPSLLFPTRLWRKKGPSESPPSSP